ncbi:hypothetical protein BU24DRAFT_448779 [Aaosphaeria arxii CBS 175.79]|uniref:FAR-17a/AIG1-like protein n=1 Tax=Aaosphaeria arxii CBS 175.79 TaxID=1450172 RepID=A0A6A5XWC8_9PLEO|nr:uncharacterized protein BU24DRAFT_448779 [Aaosphaeria arxii CBS 175.79]KAF2017011.1 hypothetical protein BU24DRAFT_448779 [Aaosphaeria arxii CBS 175.79]
MFLSYAHFGIGPEGFDPSHSFFRSNYVPTLVLASIRAIIAIYCFTTMIVCYSWLANNLSTNNLQDVNIDSYTLYIGSDGIHQSFSFFTYLTFWSLGFYFSFASMHTFCYAIKGRTWLQSWPRILQLFHYFYYTSITCFPFLVTIVFWGTMYSGPWPKGRFEQWINISVHGLNSLFALTEVVLPATSTSPWSHLSILLLVLSAYLGLAYLTRLTQGFYVYEWMNPAHGNASIILHILGYTVGIISIFVIVKGAIWLKRYLAERSGKDVTYRQSRMVRLDDSDKLNVRRRAMSQWGRGSFV